MPKRPIYVAALVLCFVFISSMSAFAFTSIVAYGDSLTDNGNLGKLTDGDVWVDTLANALGAELFNKAHLGATTGDDSPATGSTIFGLQWQIQTYQPYLSQALDMDDTLFTVWAGANDFFQARTVPDATANMAIAMQTLIDSGAKDILVPNLPDLGLTPGFYGDVQGAGTAAMASAWSTGFNATLEAQITAFELEHGDVNLYALDIEGLFADLIDIDAQGNITNPDEWQALFMPDGIHPTHISHAAVADAAYQLVNPVPVPAAFILLGSGLLGLGALRRRFK